MILYEIACNASRFQLPAPLLNPVASDLIISRAKKSLGYAVDEINSEDINAAASDNVIKSLTGKIAGLNINQTTGGEGSSTRIILRGNRYLGSNNQALIVVDGIPIDNTTSVFLFNKKC